MKFGVANKNWNSFSLENVCVRITSGGTPSRNNKSFYKKGDIYWVKTKELNNSYIEDTEEKITSLALEKSSAKLLPKNTILLAMYGATVGELGILSKEMACNQACCALIIDPNKADYRFVFYLLRLYKNEICSLATGAAQQNLSAKVIKEFEFNFPNLEEQIRISDILSSIDDKITLNTQTNQTLEQIAQTIFKSWFIDFDPVKAKATALAEGKTAEQANLAAMATLSGKTIETLSPAEYQQLWDIADAFPSEMVENEEFGEVPKGWENKKIDEIIKKIPTGKKYSQKTTLEKGYIPVLDQGRSGVIGYHNDEAGVKADINDPVIVFANHTCYMRLITYDFSAIQNVFAFKGTQCNIYWLYLATLGKQVFVEYKGHFPDFLIKEVVLPNQELTDLFGVYVKPMFSQISYNLKQNETLTQTRDVLLPKLLNGEI